MGSAEALSNGPPGGSADGGGSRGQESRLARLVSRLRAGMRVDFRELCLVSFLHAFILMIFALVTLVAVVYGLNYSFDVAMPKSILWGLIAGVVTLVLNWMYITSGEDRITLEKDQTLRKRIDVDLVPVLAVAVIIGLFLSVAATMQEFREDFLRRENVHEEIVLIKKKIGGLENEVEKLRGRVEALSSQNVDEDAALSTLFVSYRRARGEFDRARGEFDKADKEKEYICISKAICVSYVSAAGRERLDRLKNERDATKHELETVEGEIRKNIDLAATDLDKKERELAGKYEELRRVEKPAFRPGAFTSYTLREMEPFVIVILVYIVIHMVPVMLSKDDARRRARTKRQNQNATITRPKGPRCNQVASDPLGQPPEDPSVALNGSK